MGESSDVWERTDAGERIMMCGRGLMHGREF